jgi:hypothetical protein
MITLLITYTIVTAILYIIGYWLFCRSYNNYCHKDVVSFKEYFDDQCALFIVPAFAWPVVIIFFPLILLLFICYLVTREIKKYYNIEN